MLRGLARQAVDADIGVMGKVLMRIREVLARDANEVVDQLVWRYLRLFKKRPILMHALGAAMVIGPLVFLWFIAGQRWFLVVLALSTLWLVIATGVGPMRRSKFGRQS
jgi:hypothetical protein